jgi:hypothetical protein
MWYFYKVFKCFPLLCDLAISTVSVMVPYLCPVFNMWFEYRELLLLFLNACMCSLYLVRNVLPVCLMYVSGQSMHFIWQIPLSLYLSVRGCCFSMFCIVICVMNAIFIRVSLHNFVIFLVSFPLYVNVAHFVFWCCGSVLGFCFCFVGPDVL